MPKQWEEVKVIYELSDGGLVEVTDETPVPMGDSGETYAYRQLTYTNGGCRIVFEVTDGLPGCSSITLAAQGRPVRAKDLAAVKLDAIRDEAFRAVGLLVADPDGAHDAPPRLVRKVVNTATSRRRVTPEFLRQIASLCEQADGDSTQDRVEAVKAALGVTERSAYRYIAAAKEKGYIQ